MDTGDKVNTSALAGEDSRDQALNWFIKRANPEGLSSEEELKFNRWLESEPGNPCEYEAVSQLYKEITSAKVIQKEDIWSVQRKYNLSLKPIRSDQSVARTWPSLLRLSATVCVLLLAVWFGIILTKNKSVTGNYHTGLAEFHDVWLEDGSHISMDINTGLAIRFSDRLRSVQMKTGRAVFDVTHDPDKPFEVLTDTGRIEVLGTVFEVEYLDNKLRVTVSEGDVELTRGNDVGEDGFRKSLHLRARQIATVDIEGQLSDVISVDSNLFATWRDGWLNFDNQSLATVIHEMNRYYNGRIKLASDLESVPNITGRFPITDIGEFFQALRKLLPVEIVPIGDDRILIRYRQNG